MQRVACPRPQSSGATSTTGLAFIDRLKFTLLAKQTMFVLLKYFNLGIPKYEKGTL